MQMAGAVLRNDTWWGVGRGLLLAVAAFAMAGAHAGETAATSPDPWQAMHHIKRSVPLPMADHPGNVFLAGEGLVVPVPAALQGKAVQWQALDDRLTAVARGSVRKNQARAGTLGVGWYRIEFLDDAKTVIGFTTAGVLAPLTTPVPQDSPICVDTALSWFKSEEKGEDPEERKRLTNLATLAGVNWSRDRLRWDGVEAASGEALTDTKYDAAAQMQAAAGLKVLQVFHRTPAWAVGEGSNSGRVPDDLRDTYAFCRSMATRFRGKVQAWEPWNEGNAHNFGGHTLDELCAHQKAAYLGFKAGGDYVTVCWNPLGGINAARMARSILENETWPYFDVYSIHSYDWPHAYQDLWAPAREAACGRPLWVTEADRGMKADTDSPLGDFTHDFALRKAEFMAQSYTRSLYSGATRHFHFILGHYMEGSNSIQFGLLRQDLTPRPSFVALAALGRLLAGGRCLGRWATESPGIHVYAFRAQPDGVERDVLVAWTEIEGDWAARGKARAAWNLPKEVEVLEAYDYLGRLLPEGLPREVESAPVFAVLPAGSCRHLEFIAPAQAAFRKKIASSVVLQLRTPGRGAVERNEGWTHQNERTVLPGKTAPFEFNVYNLAEKPITGIVVINALPAGWRAEPDRWKVAVDPMGRVTNTLQIKAPVDWSEDSGDCWVTIRGDFGKGQDPALAFRAVRPAASDETGG
jgi:hypothetical protein